MNQLINNILSEMKEEYNISKFELEKIIDSQFKVLMNNIQDRGLKEVNIKHLGKFKPTTFLIAYKNGKIHKKNKGDSTGNI